jgi:hypothetical protein
MENESTSTIVEAKELGELVFLSFHSINLDLRLIVTIRILDRRQLIAEILVQLKSESSLRFSDEVGMGV